MSFKMPKIFQSKKKKKKPETLKEKILDNVEMFFSAYLIAFVIRMFLVEAYQIPSQSMVPSLRVKDLLMVEKFTFGPYIPLIHKKIPTPFKPKRNDVIVFVSPEWKSPGKLQELVSLLTLSVINLDNTFNTPKNLVKRLVAEPGDRVSMTNQQLYVNGINLQGKKVRTTQEVVYNRLKKMGYLSFDIYKESDGKRTRLIQHVSDVHQYLDRPEVYNLPEFRVPTKGDIIPLTNTSRYYLGLMKKLIERETGKTLAFGSDDLLYLNGELVTKWKIKQDYYFGMGDNRDLSEDCRYFGFIPRDNIFGKILFRYFPLPRVGFWVNQNEKGVQKINFTR